MGPDTFIDKAARRIAWRLKELSFFLMSVRSLSSAAQAAQVRAGVVLLYAHWEGAVREIARDYVDYVSDAGLTWRRLKPHFVAVKLAALAAGGAKKPSYYLAAATLLFGSTPAAIPSTAIDTESNLTYDVFAEILCSIGVDPAPFATRKVFIDTQLVHHRNKIAHGEGFRITEAEYVDYHNGVVALLRQFHTRIVDSVVEDAHRR